MQVNALAAQLDSMIEMEIGGFWAVGEFEDELAERIADCGNISNMLAETVLQHENR